MASFFSGQSDWTVHEAGLFIDGKFAPCRELNFLCQKADVPDKSGELLTQEGAQHFIDDLKKQLAERK